jgi:hypothetical protein
LAARKGDGPIFDADYKQRGEESDLIAKLEAEGVLLLTGRTQCGKSEIAKKVADHFYEKGFSYRVVSDMDAVENFFNLNAIEDKVCILEDPWGHIDPPANSLDTLRKLEFLVRNRRINHKLIVTTRMEILNKLNRDSINLNKVEGKEWIDITLTDKMVLSEFWRQFAEDRKLDNSVILNINDELQRSLGPSILQIGELQHLARYDNDLTELNVEQLLHIARQTTGEVAHDILTKNPDAADLLAIIGCASDTTNSIQFRHLGFILSSDDTEYSILKDTFFSTGGPGEPDPFPSYKQSSSLPANWQHQLEYLESRGLLIVRNEQVWVSHPNYFEAAKTLFVANSSLRQQRILKYFRKAIVCLAPQNALRAIKHLPFLLDHVSEQHTEEILDLAFLGLRSIFPSVADQSLIFVVSYISTLSPDRRKELEHLLDSSDTSSSHIFWQENTPFISAHSSGFFRDRFFKLPEREFVTIRQKFEADQVVTSLEAWNFIRTIVNTSSGSFTQKEANYLMRYDELFIRKKVVEIIMLDAVPDPNEELLKLVSSDHHPSVVFTVIRTILINWKSWQPTTKPVLKKLVLSSLQVEAVAIRSHQFLTTFEKEHTSESVPWEAFNEDEKKELWNLWADLYVAFISLLPAGLFLDSTGFGETIDTGFKYLEQANGLAVLNAWYNRIDYKLSRGLLLDEYELAIADVLLNFTGTNASVRATLFRKLLAYHDTGFIISSLKWTVNRWNALNTDEKNLVAALLQQQRQDNRWLRAIVLTRDKKPPRELQVEIFADPNFFDNAPQEFVEKINPQLLEDCLKLYFGHPQPLWWFATQYNNIEFWQPVVNYILTNIIEPFFSICLRELTSWGLNGFSGAWIDGLSVWKEVCEKSADLTMLADRLNYDTSRITCVIDTAKNMYDVLIFAFRKRAQEDLLIKILIDNIEMLQQTGSGAEDIVEIIDSEIFNNVYTQLKPDIDLYTSAKRLKSGSSERQAFINKLNEIRRENTSIRFALTQKVIEKILSDLSLLKSFQDEVALIPNNITEKGKQMADVWQKKDEYKLPNWIGNN